MATTNSDLITGGPYRGTHVNKFVSFTSTSGDYTSFREPDTGYYWDLRSVRVFNGEAGALDVMVFIADSAGVEHILLSNTGVAPVSVAADARFVWNGSMIVPSTWRLYVKYFSMVGGSGCDWSFSAMQYDQDSNPDN